MLIHCSEERFSSVIFCPTPQCQGCCHWLLVRTKEDVEFLGKKQGPQQALCLIQHWLRKQEWCFYQGQGSACCSLALTGPQESVVLWHQWDQNLPAATKCLHSCLIYFSKLFKQLNCSFTGNWHKMRNFGLEFNHHGSEILCCLKFGCVTVFKAGMDGVSEGHLISLI